MTASFNIWDNVDDKSQPFPAKGNFPPRLLGAPSSIAEVIEQLESIIEWAAAKQSRLGYFASLYLRVTNTIRSRIGTGYFEDDKRMGALDAVFAGRYLIEADRIICGAGGISQGWGVVFAAANRSDLVIVQHLLLGINIHIMVDLGVACAEICPGDSINSLHGDFLKVNAILAGVVPTALSEMGSLSPCIKLLDDLSEEGEKALIDFGIDEARDSAWDFALKLARAPGSSMQGLIDERNVAATKVCNDIISPGIIVQGILDIVRDVEEKNVELVIRTLDSANPVRIENVGEGSLTTSHDKGTPPNETYYYVIRPGTWRGSFYFKITSWKRLWSSNMSFKNKLFGTLISFIQNLMGGVFITSDMIQHREEGYVSNDVRIFKGWITILHIVEICKLSSNGSGVKVCADVSPGPIPILFKEHDVYRASVYDGGMKSLSHVRLMGARFLGSFSVHADRGGVDMELINDWSHSTGSLQKFLAG